MLNFSSPRIRLSLGKAALREPYPSWLLDPYGGVRAANLMAFWLWGRLDDAAAVQPDSLVGCNFFDVLAANIERIPIYRNIEFFAKQSALLKRTAASQSSSLYAPFITSMKVDPQRAKIYEDAAIAPERVWEYTLAIAMPGSEELLQLRVTNYRLEGEAGFLALTTPVAASLPLMEEQYAHIMERYGEDAYVITDKEEGPPQSAPFLSAFSNSYRVYYPTFVQDPLWYTVEENRALQMLFGASTVGLHFFELFFAPHLRPWLGPVQETSAPRAMTYFETFTKPMKREGHELHKAYLQTLQRLAQLPEYRSLVELAWRARIHLNLPENEEMPFYTCRVFLPWALAPQVTLQFRSMARYLYRGLLVDSDERYYQVILVPENYETEIALLLLYLSSNTEENIQPVYRQLLWGATLLRTIQEGLEQLDEGQTNWNPESAFARISRDLESEFPQEGEDGTEAIIPALSQSLEALNGIVDEEIVYLLLHILAEKKSLASFDALLRQQRQRSHPLV